MSSKIPDNKSSLVSRVAKESGVFAAKEKEVDRRRSGDEDGQHSSSKKEQAQHADKEATADSRASVPSDDSRGRAPDAREKRSEAEITARRRLITDIIREPQPLAKSSLRKKISDVIPDSLKRAKEKTFDVEEVLSGRVKAHVASDASSPNKRIYRRASVKVLSAPRLLLANQIDFAEFKEYFGEDPVALTNIEVGKFKDMELEQIQHLVALLSLIPPSTATFSVEPINYFHEKTSSVREKIRPKIGKSADKEKVARVKMSPASIFALKCIESQEEELLAKVLTTNPPVIAKDFFGSMQTNILSSESLLYALRYLAPLRVDNQENPIIHLDKQKTAEMFLTHYLSFPPLGGFSRQLSKLVEKQHLAATKSLDALVQNPRRYFSEIGYLIQALIERELPDARLQGFVNVEQGDDASGEDVQSETAAARAWQITSVLGHAFAFATAYARQVGKDSDKVKEYIAAAVDVLKAGMSGAGVAGPAGGVSAQAVGLLTGTLSEWIAVQGATSSNEMDLAWLAQNLTWMSESIKARAKKGLLVLGQREYTVRELQEKPVDEREDRDRLGEEFFTKYVRTLTYFQEHSLQRSLRDAAGR